MYSEAALIMVCDVMMAAVGMICKWELVGPVVLAILTNSLEYLTLLVSVLYFLHVH